MVFNWSFTVELSKKACQRYHNSLRQASLSRATKQLMPTLRGRPPPPYSGRGSGLYYDSIVPSVLRGDDLALLGLLGPKLGGWGWGDRAQWKRGGGEGGGREEEEKSNIPYVTHFGTYFSERIHVSRMPCPHFSQKKIKWWQHPLVTESSTLSESLHTPLGPSYSEQNFFCIAGHP